MPKIISSYRCQVPAGEITPYTFIHHLFYFRCLMNDRYDFLTKYSLLDWAELGEKPTSDVFNTVVSFTDELDQRAKFIIDWAEKENKKIYLLYSGGVDSTAVAVSLLRNKKPTTKIEVICTEESKNEYPLFFDFFKRENIPVTVLLFKGIFPYIQTSNNYVLTNGWCADQLFGFRDINKYKDWFSKDWTYCAKKKFEEDKKLHLWPYFKNSIDIIRDYLETVFPTPITEFAQFCWFWNHCCKLSYIRNTTSLEADTDYLRSHNVPFYNIPALINWSVANYEKFKSKNFATDPRLYKEPLKDYIVAYTKDEQYRWKTKHTSWTPMYDTVTTERCAVIDEEGFKYFGQIEPHKKYQLLLARYKK